MYIVFEHFQSYRKIKTQYIYIYIYIYLQLCSYIQRMTPNLIETLKTSVHNLKQTKNTNIDFPLFSQMFDNCIYLNIRFIYLFINKFKLFMFCTHLYIYWLYIYPRVSRACMHNWSPEQNNRIHVQHYLCDLLHVILR